MNSQKGIRAYQEREKVEHGHQGDETEVELADDLLLIRWVNVQEGLLVDCLRVL